jgi:hypothetical protein
MDTNLATPPSYASASDQGRPRSSALSDALIAAAKAAGSGEPPAMAQTLPSKHSCFTRLSASSSTYSSKL